MPYADPEKRKAYAKAYYASQKQKAIRAEFRKKTSKRLAETQREYYKNNSEKCRASSRNTRIKKAYGITAAEFDALFLKQGNKCACCGTDKPGTQKGWHIDHDHITGGVRGILCHHCNVMAGMSRDSITILRSSIAYLKRGGSIGATKVLGRKR
jgi:hypothetical protein